MNYPATLPRAHREFLERALDTFSRDTRVVGVAAGGSFAENSMDDYSDLDLVVAIEPEHFGDVMRDRREIAAGLGRLLSGFTGEHVGEPRVLICLYDQPLLHVDLKFVSLPDCAQRADDPVVLFDRDGRLRAALAAGTAAFPSPDPQWVEDRFWVWVHYGAARIARGELFEAHNFLGYLRTQVIAPLWLRQHSLQPSGVRKIEQRAPDLAAALRKTITGLDAGEQLAALRACVGLYKEVRAGSRVLVLADAEAAAMRFVAEVASDVGQAPT